MKKIYFFGLLVLTTFTFSTYAQQTFKTTLPSTIGYLEYLPDDYESNSDKYPIVIFLHGMGEKGVTSDIPSEIQKTIEIVERNGPPKHVKAGTKFPFILISPQLKRCYGDWNTWYVKEVIDYCKTYLRIDERRIYLTGLSLGGGGVWYTAQDYPQLFAAIAPVCGSRNTRAKACEIAQENLPVWAFHGEADNIVVISKSINMINDINKCVPVINPLAKLTIYPDVAGIEPHNAWDRAYRTDNSLHQPNLYEWMLSYSNTTNANNKLPFANAGSDQTVNKTKINILGSGYDTDGSINTYSWDKITGPSITCDNFQSAELKLTNLQAGVYVFRLKVTDDSGNSDSDYITVTVELNGNVEPVANAGEDKTVELPTNAVTLQGSGSDDDGSIVAYSWTQVSGVSALLNGENTATLSALSLVEGSYVFRLSVKDNMGTVNSDDVVVDVVSQLISTPTVSAGPDRKLSLPSDPAMLFGTISDPDDRIVSYQWTKVSGGNYDITSSTILRPRVYNLSSGTYVFRVTITDDSGATSRDEVTVIADYPPVAHAGTDLSLTLPLNIITLHGSGTDSDGTIASYVWSLYEGPASVRLTNKNTPIVTASKISTPGSYIFKLTVTDNVGIQSLDYATLTVVSPSGRTAFGGEQNIEASLNEELSINSTSNQIILLDNASENNFVSIYDAQGYKVFDGKWNINLYTEIFNRKGLYIYNLSKAGKRISGKVYIPAN